MENCYLSSWPEGENWAEFNATPSNESSFTVPLPIEPRFSASSSVQCQGFPSWVVPIEGVAEDRATVVSKSHSQAEKRRRDRINAQLAALRKLIPKSDKVLSAGTQFFPLCWFTLLKNYTMSMPLLFGPVN